MRLSVLCAFILLMGITTFLSYAEDPANEAENPDNNNDDAETSEQAELKPIKLDFLSDDVKRHMSDDAFELVSLTLGTQAYEFPIFVERSQKPLSMGTIYLVPDAAVNGIDFSTLMPLAREFAVQGWNSVILPSPSILMSIDHVELSKISQAAEEKNSQEAQSASEPAQEQEPTTNSNEQVAVASSFDQNGLKIPYYQNFSIYLTKVIQAAQKQVSFAGYKVIFAQGMSAEITLSAIEGSTGKVPDAMVINNIYLPNAQLNKTIPKLIGSAKIPLLDITSANDNHWSQQTINKRAIESKVQLKTIYRQRAINDIPFSPHLYRDIAKETQAWFTYMGW